MSLIDIDYFRRQPIGAKSLVNLQADILQEVLDTASDYVEDYLDKKIKETAWIERIPGNREYTLILDNYPITALTSVTYEEVTGTVGAHSPTDFLVHAEAGIIELKNKLQVFRGDRLYVVSYSAGYSVVPNPVKLAVALQAVQLLRPMYGGPQDASSVDVVPFADEMIVNLLERYRRKRIS